MFFNLAELLAKDHPQEPAQRDLSHDWRAPLGWRALGAALLLAGILSGCATAGERGDEALATGDYVQALDHYDRAFEAGDKDAERAARAARAALKIGDLADAERYFSRALRYGAGEDVARELAELYISTSNYTKAVRVLQEILETTDDTQTIFNNLGAALMYAGSPLNAESYLLVAQQMDPADPVPYVNLGVLYERHLHNPRLAYGFYNCFVELDDDSRQSGKVKARMAALDARFKGDFPEQFQVECGQAYQPAASPTPDKMREALARNPDLNLGDLSEPGHENEAAKSGQNSAQQSQQQVELQPGQQPEKQPNDTEGAQPETSEKIDPQSNPNTAPGTITDPFAGPQEQGKDDKTPDSPDAATNSPGEFNSSNSDDSPVIIKGLVQDGRSDADPETQAPSARALTLAEQAFSDKNYREVLKQLGTTPESKLDAHALGLLGRSALALGEYEQAGHWLRAAVDARPDRNTVNALWAVYDELNDNAGALKLCQQFSGKPRYRELQQKCADRSR